MAINANDYTQTKEKNIKLHKKDKRLFLFDFRIDGKRYRKSFKIKATNHSPRDNLKEARLKLEEIKEDMRNGYSSKSSSLDVLFINLTFAPKSKHFLSNIPQYSDDTH